MAEDTAAPTPAKSTAPDISGMYSLKVDNIAYRVDVGRVREMFAAHGEIGDVYMPRDRTTGNSRGFAFVRFIDKNEAEDAIKAMNEKEIEGRAIRVAFAEEPRAANPRERYLPGGDRAHEHKDYMRPAPRGPPPRYERGRDDYDRGRGPDRGGWHNDRRDDRPYRRSPSRDRRDSYRDDRRDYYERDRYSGYSRGPPPPSYDRGRYDDRDRRDYYDRGRDRSRDRR